MQSENCRYCLNIFTLANPPLIISCSHYLCLKCIIFLNENFQNQCFWCKCNVSYNPENLRFHQSIYNQILKKNHKLCLKHNRKYTNISKFTLIEYCEYCLKQGNINTDEIEDIIYEERVVTQFIEEKTQKVEKLIKAYEGKLEAVDKIEKFDKKIDNAKEIYEILSGYKGYETFEEKLAILQNLDLFEFLDDTEIEDKLTNLDKEKILIGYLNAFSSEGIAREKRLLNWNDKDGVWLGDLLFRTQMIKMEFG
ncbi:hypothetical protein SteCoe_3992 [Stentor coeruleus]|uniref:RING-type domain-containing protein n=1 Tax=Stentor coeruleus TaxID=5963 RepID=A0A1R2CVP5_9CILI|nr:hypothetical protein SteCoe_3992 [Stentor coeruleus]